MKQTNRRSWLWVYTVVAFFLDIWLGGWWGDIAVCIVLCGLTHSSATAINLLVAEVRGVYNSREKALCEMRSVASSALAIEPQHCFNNGWLHFEYFPYPHTPPPAHTNTQHSRHTQRLSAWCMLNVLLHKMHYLLCMCTRILLLNCQNTEYMLIWQIALDRCKEKDLLLDAKVSHYGMSRFDKDPQEK